MGRAPLARWSDTDHSAPIIIVTVLGLVYWLVPGVGQMVISFGQRSSLTWSSRLYLASMVCQAVCSSAVSDRRQIFGFAQSVVLLVAISYGFGKAIASIPSGEATICLRVSPAEKSNCSFFSPYEALPRKQRALCRCSGSGQMLRDMLNHQLDCT